MPTRERSADPKEYRVIMAISAGHYVLGPDNGRLLLCTRRQGMAASIGHDLTIEVSRWSADVDVAGEPAQARIEARVDLGSLVVVEGTGGALPLTADNRRDIQRNATKALESDRFPEAVFVATGIDGTLSRATIDGNLTLRGVTMPQRLDLDEAALGEFRAGGTVVQTRFGIKPYSAFLGALKLRDEVEVGVELTVGAPAAPGAA